MQMCANRKHCSSAWLSVSVTPLCSGLSLVPLREMFPFKCYLSVSFKTSSFPFDKQPGGMARAGSLSKLFSYQAWGGRERERERCSAGAFHRHPRLCLIFFLSSPQRMSYSMVGSKVCFLPALPLSLTLYRCSTQVHTSLSSNSTCTYSVMYVPYQRGIRRKIPSLNIFRRGFSFILHQTIQSPSTLKDLLYSITSFQVR